MKHGLLAIVIDSTLIATTLFNIIEHSTTTQHPSTAATSQLLTVHVHMTNQQPFDAWLL